MFSKIKKIYTARTAREKFLILAVIWLPLLYWLSVLDEKQTAQNEDLKKVLLAKEHADMALSQKQLVEVNLKKAMGDFDEAKLIKDLRIELEGVLRGIGIPYTMNSPEPKVSGRMTVHTAVVTLKGVSLETVISLEKSLLARAPYIFVDLAEFNADGKGVLSVRYEIKSFEFNKK